MFHSLKHYRIWPHLVVKLLNLKKRVNYNSSFFNVSFLKTLSDMASSRSEIIKLEKESELKITLCEPFDKIILQLIEGSAEIFGSQLHVNKDYEFSYFTSFTVFTAHGCTMKIVNEESMRTLHKINTYKQIPKMIDLHEYLEELRVNADVNNTDGPVTLIVGPTDVGKSTLCRFLLNYAAKQGRKPIFIDLDVGQGSLSVTGTFGILSVEEPSDVYGRFNEQAISVYYFGYSSPGHNMMLYKLLLENLGISLKKRLCQECQTRNSGVIINTCGWIDGGGYNLIKAIIKFLNVNVVLVLAKTSLYHELKQDVSYKTEILRVPEIKGVVTRDKTIRKNNRDTSVYEYFYGSTRQLESYTIKVHFNDLRIFKANSSAKIKSHKVKNSNIIPVSIEPSILYHIFGLSYAERIEDILISSIYGFICIIELDMDSKIASVLSPRPGPLPTNYLLMGDIMLMPT